MAGETIRTFVALPLSSDLIEQVGDFQKALQRDLAAEGVRWTKPEQLHLTLRFLGNVLLDDLDRLTASVEAACRASARFEIRLEQLGCFPSPQRPSVLWLGLGGDLERLAQLQRGIQEATSGFGSHQEDRAFKPHLTIARFKPHGPEARRFARRLDQAKVPRFAEWRAAEVVIMQSKLSSAGSTYTVRARCLLP